MNRDLAWPIGIIATFAVAILGFGSYIVFAVNQRNDLVVPDYYRNALAYTERMDSLARAQALAEPPALVHDDAARVLRIRFPADVVRSLQTGQIKLYRPSNADLDLTIPVQLNAGGLQSVDTARLASGLWKVQLSWLAEGQSYFIENPLVLP